ncbi:CheW-like domain-containing protein [Desulfuromusa kysingii]|uniref:CheW-like domain-containing protein n=1 Tax=Desulfuromusa kysingii TaxID=37625 RepID=A0A1H4C333_9BACT|nr:chemotaxis protein CheW [Desulfuromusa kysingii]SEA54811.1 CheW-like domain-containing protein [Desulfuromusa kysingii]
MKRYGLFRFGTLNYALSLLQIQKIKQGLEAYPLPRLPGAVAAVLVDDDQLVPLLDLSWIQKEDLRHEVTKQGYQVLIDSEYGTVALPAEVTGRIVSEQKGTLSEVVTAKEKEFGTVAKFVYQRIEYNILDINFLAIELTQGFWNSRSDTGGARRHQ